MWRVDGQAKGFGSDSLSTYEPWSDEQSLLSTARWAQRRRKVRNKSDVPPHGPSGALGLLPRPLFSVPEYLALLRCDGTSSGTSRRRCSMGQLLELLRGLLYETRSSQVAINHCCQREFRRPLATELRHALFERRVVLD